MSYTKWTLVGIFVFLTIVFLMWKGRGEKTEEKPVAKTAASAPATSQSDPQVAELQRQIAELREKLKQPVEQPQPEQPVAEPPPARGKKPIPPVAEAPAEPPDPQKTADGLKKTKQQAEDALARAKAKELAAMKKDLAKLQQKLEYFRSMEKHVLKVFNDGVWEPVGFNADIPEKLERTEKEVKALEEKIASLDSGDEDSD